MHFYLTFRFLRFKVLKKRMMNLFKVVKVLDFRIFSGRIQKYKPALSKSNSCQYNSYCVRSVTVSLDVNIGKLQSLVSGDNFFCSVFNDFCCDFLLYDVINFVSMYKSVVECCVDKNFSDRLSSFERCWSSCWWSYGGVFSELIKRLY